MGQFAELVIERQQYALFPYSPCQNIMDIPGAIVFTQAIS